MSNETNGIEPPRDYLSIKKSKKGPLKQIVPQYNTLKNNYTLLWDMKSNEGYIHVVAVMQKFFDQAISGNWSYNPENYPENKIPVSVMAGDFLTTYKYGWKTSYYQNTYDSKTDEVEDKVEEEKSVEDLLQDILNQEEEACDSQQFRVGGEDKKKIEGMTVFNKNQVDTTKQHMFFGAPLGVQRYDNFKYPVFDKLTHNSNLVTSGDLKKFHYKKIVPIINNSAQNRSTSSRRTLSTRSCLTPYKVVVLVWHFMPYCSAYLKLEGAMNIWQTMEMVHSRSYTTSLRMYIQILLRCLMKSSPMIRFLREQPV